MTCLAKILCLTSAALCAGLIAADDNENEAERLFAQQVFPLLQERCFACHGGKPDEIKGKLDLTSREKSLQGGESGMPAFVPGEPAQSLIVSAIRWDELEMPPKENDRLTAEQIEQIVAWIAAGGAWPDEARRRQLAGEWSAGGGGVAMRTSGGLSEDWTNRRYKASDVWAFQPLAPAGVPWEALPEDAPRHPIDAFIAARLSDAEIEPAPRANRFELLRRLCFDLTGLPPSPELAEGFADDDSADAWPALIDRLLARPQYGERMAQHWLDVARYADTSGFSNDFERPQAWRYRDYVIRSFNEDKPYDRFILEQIAGDELAPGEPEGAVAVGFLRMGPWEHTGMSVAAVTRQLWLDDVTNSVGETFLGNSLRCARCHDHKFDPIPTRDYYSIQAAFAATQFDEPAAPHLPGENVADAERRMAITARQLSRDGVEAITKLEGDNAFTRIHKKLDAYRELAMARYEPVAFSVKNDQPQQVSILTGGSLESPLEEVSPGVLSAAPNADEFSLPLEGPGRRLALARWIADEQNPLTARTIVNRVWQWHFGRGLAATPNNLGTTGSKPTHPELLDWLAAWFMENGWSMKALHRLILTSAAWQRGSQPPAAARLAAADPENTLWSHFSPRRLSAEEMRDAMLAVSGELSLEAGGPGVFPEINWEAALQPRHIMGGIAPSYRPSLSRADRHRRTIYAFRYRGLSDPMLEVFNRPGADLSCERRDETTITPQAFELMNGDFARHRALALAGSIAGSVDDAGRQIEQAFERVYLRTPSEMEGAAAAAHFQRMLAHHRRNPAAEQPLPTVVQREMIAEETGVLFRWNEKLALEGYERSVEPWEVPPETRALAELCLVLLNSSEFLYVY